MTVPTDRTRALARKVPLLGLLAALATCARGSEPGDLDAAVDATLDGARSEGGRGDGGGIEDGGADVRCTGSCTLPHATARCIGGACIVGACDMGWLDADGRADNGCECEGGGHPTSCVATAMVETLAMGDSRMVRGALAGAGQEHWFRVRFAEGGHARVMLEDSSARYRIEVQSACGSGTDLSCEDRPAGATGLTEWEFYDQPGDAGTDGMSAPTRNVPFPAEVVVRVYATAPSTACEPYTLRFSN
jgi:hypothetical protein